MRERVKVFTFTFMNFTKENEMKVNTKNFLFTTYRKGFTLLAFQWGIQIRGVNVNLYTPWHSVFLKVGV